MIKSGVTFPTLQFRSKDLRAEKLQRMKGYVLKAIGEISYITNMLLDL